MLKKIFTPRIIYIAGIILAAALFRLVPHWPNFTPVAAIALFGGACLNKRYLAFLIPLTALFISDLILGFHGMMGWVYTGFIITACIGLLLKKRITPLTVTGASLLSSVIFFLLTNFGAWIASPIYPDSFAGLVECYVAGLAFFHDGSYGISFFMNEILGSLFYNTILFGSLYLVSRRFPALAKV
ncbi:MAG: hypothetical protein PHD25_10155 [Bacteroidales bacterium]|nr:hypothetical protein [Bacteroidales bacterium]